jgi:hypothetical protein
VLDHRQQARRICKTTVALGAHSRRPRLDEKLLHERLEHRLGNYDNRPALSSREVVPVRRNLSSADSFSIAGKARRRTTNSSHLSTRIHAKPYERKTCSGRQGTAGVTVSIGSSDRLTPKSKPPANHLQTGPSEMHAKIACDHDDHDYYADNVENIHCFAPIENKRVLSASDLSLTLMGPAFAIADRLARNAERRVR